MWFTSRVEATSTELCLLYLERVHSSAATYCAARDLLCKSALTAGSPSLLDLFSISILPSYNILSLSLSLLIPADCYTHASMSQLLVTVRYYRLNTEPELDSITIQVAVS